MADDTNSALLETLEIFRSQVQYILDRQKAEHETNMVPLQARIDQGQQFNEDFLRRSGLESAIPSLWEEIKYWPMCINAGKSVDLLGATNISGTAEGRGSATNKVRFEYAGVPFCLTREDKGMGLLLHDEFWRYIKFQLSAHDSIVLSVTYTIDYSSNKYCDESEHIFHAVDVLDIGSWVQPFIELEAKSRIAAERRLQEDELNEARKLASQFPDGSPDGVMSAEHGQF